MAEGELAAFDEREEDEPGRVVYAWVLYLAVLAHLQAQLHQHLLALQQFVDGVVAV